MLRRRIESRELGLFDRFKAKRITIKRTVSLSELPVFARRGDYAVRPIYHEFGRRLAGDLPEGMRKCRHAGIAEIGGQLLDRDVGVRRQPFDRGGDAGALAPALEAQLRLRGKQPRQCPRRGADLAGQRSRSRGRRRDRRSTMSAARRQRGSCGSGMKVAESSAWCSSSIASLTRSAVRSGAALGSNSARIAWCSRGETRTTNSDVEAVRRALALQPGRYRNRACASRCRPARRWRAAGRAGTQTARSGGTSQRPFGVVTCMVPLRGIDQLRLAVHVGVEPPAFPVALPPDVRHRRSRGGCRGPRRLAFRR